ncbi:YIPF3 isoform 4 [Pan troglodytes]|uniref:Yip1 domain family member 3 n=3 Tax=Hominidae TaxID=9604 RepID=D6RAY4_HUMAN|nr:Yip1 domain family member 3 [Homo sapiens]KAI4018439.1 Yip1 domain family member 3 [Homo sapiens]PNI77448.1 YIPF3 isoform 4 [Pan troglodytes]PNJ89223.1 YIPF3 isoform 4 [Pongo abelii]
MATTAAPAGGARNGAGPEWGGFEENIQQWKNKALNPGMSRGLNGWNRKVLHSRSHCLHRAEAQL